MVSQPVETKVQNDLIALKQNSVPFVSVGAHSESSLKWVGTLIGPKGSPYVGFCFKFEVRFSNTYPKDPPEVFFVEKIPPHMNVDSDGHVCNVAITTEEG